MRRPWLATWIPRLSVGAIAGILLTCSACSRSTRHTTKVEVVQAQVFGGEGGPSILDLDLLFTECPGAQRKIIRGDKAFAGCAKKIAKGDKLEVELLTTYKADRGEYRSEIVKVGECERKVDPKDDASYEVVQQCTDVTIHGIVTGVHCDRTRSDELVAKCPWFRRK